MAVIVHLAFLCLVSITPADLRSIGHPTARISGNFDVVVGEELQLSVVFQGEPGFVGTLRAYNAFLSPKQYIPASVVVFASDHRKLTDLAVSANPTVAATKPVPINRSRSAGRMFRVQTIDPGDGRFFLPSGNYFIQVTYFRSLLSGTTDSSEIIAESKKYPIKVREP